MSREKSLLCLTKLLSKCTSYEEELCILTSFLQKDLQKGYENFLADQNNKEGVYIYRLQIGEANTFFTTKENVKTPKATKFIFVIQ